MSAETIVFAPSHAAFERRRWPDSPTTCAGVLRIVDRTGPIWTIVCDACPFEAGLPARDADRSSLHDWETAA